MKNSIKTLAVFIIATSLAITACKKDKTPEPEKPKPTITNVEVGLNNNEIGVIGKDFHLNADIVAGDKIENIQIKILPRNGETYSKPWKFELTWEEFKGAKNTNVHKHFNIPTDAVEGKYDFFIIVNDQNGSKLEEKRAITIYSETNLPVNPSVALFMMFNNKLPFYINTRFLNENKLKIDDEIKAEVTIDDVKGDGKMYILLINKKLNHRPESIGKIDFSKVIVYDVIEHKDWTSTTSFSNASTTKPAPSLKIGANTDNNLPTPSSINGAKVWETGTYYFGFIYHNSTYNMGLFNYVEVALNMN